MPRGGFIAYNLSRMYDNSDNLIARGSCASWNEYMMERFKQI